MLLCLPYTAERQFSLGETKNPRPLAKRDGVLSALDADRDLLRSLARKLTKEGPEAVLGSRGTFLSHITSLARICGEGAGL